MWCENQNLCTMQAALLEYFGMALALWWLLICFNLFLSIVVYRTDSSTNEDIQNATQAWEKYYHACAWGIPGVLSFYLGYNNKLGYPVYGNPSYCWITDEDSSVWEFSFFFIEILVFVVVGMIFFGMILQKLSQRLALTSGEYTLCNILSKMWKVIIFIFAFA